MQIYDNEVLAAPLQCCCKPASSRVHVASSCGFSAQIHPRDISENHRLLTQRSISLQLCEKSLKISAAEMSWWGWVIKGIRADPREICRASEKPLIGCCVYLSSSHVNINEGGQQIVWLFAAIVLYFCYEFPLPLRTQSNRYGCIFRTVCPKKISKDFEANLMQLFLPCWRFRGKVNVCIYYTIPIRTF
jgi:hypothetical protein